MYLINAYVCLILVATTGKMMTMEALQEMATQEQNDHHNGKRETLTAGLTAHAQFAMHV